MTGMYAMKLAFDLHNGLWYEAGIKMDTECRKILIADDNKDIHDDIKYILDMSSVNKDEFEETKRLREELFGETDTGEETAAAINVRYSIDDAYQGNEAVEMVRRARESGDPYSLIFMDVRMPPGMDGIKTIEKIWEIDPDVGVVICTAYSDYSWNQIVAKLGHNDNLLFIRKPFDNISLKQIALAMTTKWSLKRQVDEYIGNLEKLVEARTNELTATVGILQKEIALRKEKEKLLAYSAHYDYLTNLLNRRSFYTSLLSLINEGTYKRECFSLFYIDLDNFKNVNDVYGHDIGDMLLREVAERICSVLENHACLVPDHVTDDGCVKAIFRLGGDEFTALVNETERGKTAEIAQRLIEAIKVPYFISDHELDISCCIGISTYQRGNVPANVLLKFADVALYEAKRIHGAYRFHEHSDTYMYPNENRMETELREAVEKNQIDVYLQNLVDTNDTVVGAQALVRWRHPEFGELEPDQFLHIAQKSGQIIAIGNYVLRKSLDYLKRIHETGHKNMFIMVSCTSMEFYHPGFADMVKTAVRDARVDPRYLKLNLEDKFPFQAAQGALSIIRELNDAGIQFAINGFDSDYSAFMFLKQVPRDTMIKLNKAYVKNIVTDVKNRRFLLALMDIIQTCDLGVIISGIESQEQKKLLNSRKCILQGYHFNKPEPFDRYIEKLGQGE